MLRAASTGLNRLRATWFGSVLALVWLVSLTVAPVARHCIGIAAVRGGPSGTFCSWTPALENPTGIGLVLLLAFVAVIVTVPLVFPYRPVLLLVGLGSAAIVVALIAISLDFERYLALSRLGLRLTSEAQSVLLFLLPVSVLWIVAGFRRRGPEAREASG
jgi:hypothetical protein